MLSKGEERVTQAELGMQSIESGRKQGVFVRPVAGTCRTLSLISLLQKTNLAPCALCFLRAWKTRLRARETYLCY